MWNLVTNSGNFWIISKTNGHCLLGVDDYDLGWYNDFNAPQVSVVAQETGLYAWDVQFISKDDTVLIWRDGEPAQWLFRAARFP